MGAREEIATAASTVEGVDVSPYYRLVSSPGQGYVEWLRTDYPNRLGGEDYWGVVIMLPPDLAAAQRWIAENRPALVKALDVELYMTQARPELELATDNPSQRVLVLEGHRASEE